MISSVFVEDAIFFLVVDDHGLGPPTNVYQGVSDDFYNVELSELVMPYVSYLSVAFDRGQTFQHV